MATKQEILDVLRRARERIADPARRCQNRLARDGHGEPVPVSSPLAVAWCAMGAIYAEVAKGTPGAVGEQADALLETTAYAMFNRSEVGVNGALRCAGRCPITAVAADLEPADPPWRLSEWSAAAAQLGLTPEDAHAIVCAADDASDTPTPTAIPALRRLLLAACGLPVTS